MSQIHSLETSYSLGELELKNRVVMAPLTRSRALNHLPNELMVSYYEARASAGLIIAEGTSPSPHGLGYTRIPGIYSKEQTDLWKPITKAVHARGGHIFLQLMHTGRVSHRQNMPEGALVLSPSAIPLTGTIWTDASGNLPYDTPIAMTSKQILQTIGEYATAAKNAIEAGFDGVELHGANGYLIEQFLNPESNQRDDEWGGSPSARNRFAIEVARAVSVAIGAKRVTMRLSPYGVFNGMKPFPEVDAQYVALAQELKCLNLAGIHLVDHSAMGAPPVPTAIKTQIRETFGTGIILCGGYNWESGNQVVASGLCDLVAYGRPFISNPNLFEKMKSGQPLTESNPATYYTPGPEGYTDYPV